MKVTSKQIDKLNSQITLDIANEDYSEAVRKKLAERRRNAEFKGFRKGNVPASLIQKIYGEQCLADAVNQVIYEQLEAYINKKKLNILGEPLPSEKQPEIEWKAGNDFKFVFDIALQPEVNVEISKEDIVNKYNVDVAAKEKDEIKERMTKYYTEQKIEKSAEEIDKEVSDRLHDNYKNEAEWRLTKDIRNYLIEKAAIELPEAFLKRWLLAANSGKVTAEQVEKEFPAFLEDYKWQLVRTELSKKYELKIETEDIKQAALAMVSYQYAMYGMADVPQDIIQKSAENLMADDKQVSRLEEQVEDQKVMDMIRETITIKSKKISSAKFRELK